MYSSDKELKQEMKTRILKYLDDKYSSVPIETIASDLDLSVDEIRVMQEALKELVKVDFEVYETKNKSQQRYILYDRCPNFRKAYFQSKGDFGFALLKNSYGEEDWHIGSSNMGFACDGDFCVFEIVQKPSKSNKDLTEGKVIAVLKEASRTRVCEVVRNPDTNELYLKPKTRTNLDIRVNPEDLKKCVEGEIVSVEILDIDKKNRCVGKIFKHICHKDDPGQDILTVAAANDIFADFPKEVMDQVEKIPTSVSPEEFKNRVDLTNEMIFTIDGADTKDIDDAISYSFDPINGVHTLGVHIADVSYYVKEGTPLDDEAFARGTSNYLANTVIPMLPHKLSNGICSLNEGVDRCALSCIMKIDDRSMHVEASIFPSVIHSNKKMTYDNVNEILEHDNIPEGYEPFAETLKGMQILAHKLRKQRSNHGASDFDVPEGKCICDENGKCIDVVKRERGEGEKLIEDFMIAANEAVARRFAVEDLPSIYRVHDTPSLDKVQDYIKTCELMGMHIKGKFKTIDPVMFQKLFKQVVAACDEDVDKKNVMASLAVRCTPKAVYSENNYGHFGLASTCYTHFTSPIRRLCDFYVHRLIHTFIIEKRIDDKTINFYYDKVVLAAKQASDREQIAVKAEREVDKMKYAEYMEDHIGEEFTGTITEVRDYGFYVQLDNLVTGCVSLKSIVGDYYEYVEELNCVIGKSTKQRYSLGDKVDIKVVAASKEAKQIDFELTKVLNREIEDDVKSLKKI